MIQITDEILNKYLDSELNREANRTGKISNSQFGRTTKENSMH